jgi:ribosome-binding factor A
MKSQDRRPRRVAEAIREIVAPFLQTGLRDPRIGLVTVTGVHVTPDLQRAVVSVVVHGEDADIARTLEGLASAAGAARHEVGRQLSLRTVPEIVFEFDKNVDHSSHIASVLAQLKRLEGDGEDGAA